MNQYPNKIPEDRLLKQTTETDDAGAMLWERKTTGYGPALILDVDNGVDFSFGGMGLRGNRDPEPEPETESPTD